MDEMTKEKKQEIQSIINVFSSLHDYLIDNCNLNKEIQLAFERLEEAKFWAIKGITREDN